MSVPNHVFTHEYCQARHGPISADETIQEVEFVERVLELRHGERLIDVGCGMGRHALEFSARGYVTTGVDVAGEPLRLARQKAAERGVAAKFVESDARGMPYKAEFDAAVCLGSFLGFFESHTDNLQVLVGIRQALKRDGRLLLHVTNRDFMAMQDLVPFSDGLQIWKASGDTYVLDEWRFDVLTSRISVKVVVLTSAGPKTLEYSRRVYSCHELLQMLATGGFGIEALFGNFEGARFRPSSRRLIALARAR